MVLGPILYLFFINDISNCIKETTVRSFADGTRISQAITCEHDVITLQNDLDEVAKWSVKNSMNVPSLSANCMKRHWKTLNDNSFAVVGPKLWNSIPYQLNSLTQFDVFKSRHTAFLLTVPDKPPIKDYTPQNSNSLLGVGQRCSSAANDVGRWRPDWGSVKLYKGKG